MTAHPISSIGKAAPSAATVIDGRIGKLATRLAETKSEVKQAQHVRYKVFCEELGAKPQHDGLATQRDEDEFDDACDHLLLFDNRQSEPPLMVGTQRFQVAEQHAKPGMFYSSREFDISSFLNRHPEKRFMELGRSCVLPEYRNRRTMELLWHGTWQYALRTKSDVMFGCASFHTDDPAEIADELRLLASIDIGEEWRVDKARHRGIDLNAYGTKSEDPKRAVRKLPPLIKGYLRLGAGFSSVAVHDPDFGTIDVLVILPLSMINPRYIAHYGSDATRHRR